MITHVAQAPRRRAWPTWPRRSRRRSSTCSSPRRASRREETGAKGLCLAGGVAANSSLRERILDACIADGLRAFLPSRAMCTDNAAMVAAAAWWRLRADGPTGLDAGANPNLRLA